jgi:hypothetical protein
MATISKEIKRNISPQVEVLPYIACPGLKAMFDLGRDVTIAKPVALFPISPTWTPAHRKSKKKTN